MTFLWNLLSCQSHQLLFSETNTSVTQSVCTPTAAFPPVSQDVRMLKGFPLAFLTRQTVFSQSVDRCTLFPLQVFLSIKQRKRQTSLHFISVVPSMAVRSLQTERCIKIIEGISFKFVKRKTVVRVRSHGSQLCNPVSFGKTCSEHVFSVLLW